MKIIEINFVKDFTEYPGTRSRSSGDHSGEQFYEEILLGEFKRAISEDAMLSICLDGAAGYASSFLDEVFGRLGLEFGVDECRKRLLIISNEQPSLIKNIFQSIEEWYIDGVHDNSPLKKQLE